jgi:hypothetical protein
MRPDSSGGGRRRGIDVPGAAAMNRIAIDWPRKSAAQTIGAFIAVVSLFSAWGTLAQNAPLRISLDCRNPQNESDASFCRSMGETPQEPSSESAVETPRDSKLLPVTMTTKIVGGPRPIIKGETNLPDGTQLSVLIDKQWLPDGAQRLASGLSACGTDCLPLSSSENIIVKDGRFRDGPFTDKGSDLIPRLYLLDITTSVSQPQSVVSVIGDRGQNLRGELVYTIENNGQYVRAQFPWSPDRSESERDIGFVIYYTQWFKIKP